jgi:hypothetical protein
MTPGTYDFPDVLAGDTVAKRRFTVTRTAAGVTAPENLTGVAIDCWFARTEPDSVDVQMSVGDGITIVNAAAGIFEIGEFAAPATPAIYRYDVQFAYPDGRKRTYIAGKMRVRSDVTSP